MRTRYGSSPWIHAPASSRPVSPRFRRDRTADVVVGAGITVQLFGVAVSRTRVPRQVWTPLSSRRRGSARAAPAEVRGCWTWILGRRFETSSLRMAFAMHAMCFRLGDAGRSKGQRCCVACAFTASWRRGTRCSLLAMTMRVTFAGNLMRAMLRGSGLRGRRRGSSSRRRS